VKNKKKLQGCIKVFALILMLAVFFFIITFICKFRFRALPESIDAWGSFGAYATFIASLLNLLFFIILTYAATVFQEDSYKQQLEFQKLTFRQQMLAQKAELQTSFRRSHIEDIQQRMFALNNLTYYDLSISADFLNFKRECESLIRIFRIYESNKNPKLIGNHSYEKINNKFEELRQVLDERGTNNVAKEYERKQIWEILNQVNFEIVTLVKELSDHAVEELERVFETESVG
jgi:hypothetical protein